MLIQIKRIRENIDGSANVEVVFDNEGHKLLLQHGLESMLVKAIENMKGKKNGVQLVLGAVPQKGRKANSAKIVGKTKSGKPTKGSRSNSRASKILDSKRN
jgi:hypothetical protein